MALADIIKALFGSKADRDYKAVKPLLNKILSKYEEIDKLSAVDLRSHSAKLRQCLLYSCQSIGLSPAFKSISFVFEKCLHPKKPP